MVVCVGDIMGGDHVRLFVLALSIMLFGSSGVGVAGSIEGEVFVVRKGLENIRLALVEIRAIPEQDIASYINEKSEGAYAGLQSLPPKIIEAKKNYDLATAVKNDPSYWSTPLLASRKRGESAEEYQRRKDEYSASKATWNAHRREVDKKIVEARRIYGDLRRNYFYLGTAHYFFSNLPASSFSAKTNSDGKFKVQGLPPGKYALTASAGQANFDDNVGCYWMTWVTVGKGTSHVMLSNDNMFRTKCTECVIKDDVLIGTNRKIDVN